jgi:CBS domain-containing protein
MNLLSIAHVPPVIVSPNQSVMEAIEVSLPQRVGAVAVVEKGRLVGIFTERDVMLKVVRQRMDPDHTLVGDVMTRPVTTVKADTSVGEVLGMMLSRHIRHLPISEDGTEVEGMLSIRNVLQHMVEELQSDLHHMQAYVAGDSVTGRPT